MNSLLRTMGAVKKCQVGWRKSLENPSQWGTSLAVMLWVTLFFEAFSVLLVTKRSNFGRVRGALFFLISTVWQSFSTDAAVELSFHKNGRFMGVAFSLGTSVPLGRALFPHVLCKSCSVRFHLDPTTPPWYPGPEGFTPLAALSAGQKVRATLAPTSRAQCEVRGCSWVSIWSILMWIVEMLNKHYYKVFLCFPVVIKNFCLKKKKTFEEYMNM